MMTDAEKSACMRLRSNHLSSSGSVADSTMSLKRLSTIERIGAQKKMET